MLSPTPTWCTVIEEIEIWRAANQLIEHYGQDAALEAAQRAD